MSILTSKGKLEFEDETISPYSGTGEEGEDLIGYIVRVYVWRSAVREQGQIKNVSSRERKVYELFDIDKNLLTVFENSPHDTISYYINCLCEFDVGGGCGSSGRVPACFFERVEKFRQMLSSRLEGSRSAVQDNPRLLLSHMSILLSVCADYNLTAGGHIQPGNAEYIECVSRNAAAVAAVSERLVARIAGTWFHGPAAALINDVNRILSNGIMSHNK